MRRVRRPSPKPGGRPEPTIDSDVVDRFWRLVDFGDSDACWPWLGLRNRAGYGMFNVDGRAEGAHRIAYKLGKRRWPLGLVVMHKCDSPPCCNPAHLKLGDTARNVADMVKKGRQARGSGKPWAKLNEQLVAEMRTESHEVEAELLAQSPKTYGLWSRIARVIAARRGLGHTLVYAAITYKTWDHVP